MDLPEEIDRKIAIDKASNGYSNKGIMITKILENYYKDAERR